jgi:hypothetical protein
LISRDWHHGPTVSLAKLSFQEHANLAAQHSGKDHWEYRRLDVYAVEAVRSSKTAGRGNHVPSELSWLDQQGLNVKDASKDGTVDDVPSLVLSVPCKSCLLCIIPYIVYWKLIVDGPGSPLQIHK